MGEWNRQTGIDEVLKAALDVEDYLRLDHSRFLLSSKTSVLIYTLASHNWDAVSTEELLAPFGRYKYPDQTLRALISNARNELPNGMEIKNVHGYGYRFQFPSQDYSKLQGVQIGDALFDGGARILYFSGDDSMQNLSRFDCLVLTTLVENPGEVFSKRNLMELTGTSESVFLVRMTRLKDKLRGDFITNQRKQGYSLATISRQ